MLGVNIVLLSVRKVILGARKVAFAPCVCT